MSIKAKYSPENRFENFSDHWKSAKLVDLCEINSKTSGNLPDQFYYIDLESVNQGVLSDEIELLNRSDAPSRAQRLLEKGDVLYQTVRPYQRNNYLFNLDNTTEFVASTGYAVLKPRKVNSQFLYQIMNTDNFTKEVMARTTGTSFPAISPRDLAEIVIKLPSQKEQKKIGEFLSVIDHLINSKEKEIEKMNELKKAYMQQIFNQELRFKNNQNKYYSNWKEKKLGEIAEIKTGYTPATSDPENFNGDYVWYGITDFKNKYIRNSKRTISEKGFRENKLIKQGTLLMSFKLSIGELAITKTDCLTNEAIANFNWLEKIDTEFMYYNLKNTDIKKYGNRAVQGITLNSESLNSIEIKLPEFEEQKQIGNFLSLIDQKIELKNQELEKIKKYKKAFLKKMFV